MFRLTTGKAFITCIIGSTLFFSGCKKETTTLPDIYPFEVTVDNNPAPGRILVSPYNANADTGRVFLLDQNGKLIKSKRTDGPTMNFTRWEINGQVRYTYLVGDNSGYHIPNYYAYIAGYYVIADSNLNEIRRVYLHAYGDVSNTQQTLLDSHDFVLISDDHYIVESYYDRTVTNIPDTLNPASSVRVVDPVIQEINNDQVVWQWETTDYPEMYANSVESNNYQDSVASQDFAHMNALAIDPNDNNLLCSFRNLNTIIKINRQNGSIMWRLGGKESDFPLTADQKFLRQHNVSVVDNNTLMVFDNGEAGERAYSRVLEFKLDEVGKTVTAFNSFNVPGDFAQYMGSVVKNDSLQTYFIGGGSAKYMVEANYATGEKVFELKLDENSYRSFKYYY